MKLPSCRRGLRFSATAGVKHKSKAWRCLLLLSVLLCAAQIASSQTPPTEFSKASTEEKLAQLDQRTTAAQSSADNAWMLVSAALVLMMTGPGLALFYGGLVRKKNVLGTMMQSFAMMAVITVLWALILYSLCFGSGTSFIGGLSNAFLHGV